MTLKISRKRWNLLWKIGGTVAILVIVACSVTINTVTQPASVNAGDVLNVTLTGTISTNSNPTANLMVGFLVPKVWNAAANAKVTFTSNISNGPQGMSSIPTSQPAPNGNGLSWQTDLMNTLGHAGNLIPEYEWVAFYSDQAYPTSDNTDYTVTVNIQIPVGQTNLWFNMEYCLAESNDGLHSTVFSNWPPTSYYSAYIPSTPIRVYGPGTLVDFIHPQLSVVTPSTALDNDIIALPFNSTLVSNGLSNATSVYLCATGYTNAGDSIQVCQQTSKTQLVSQGAGQWQIDIWPRGFFNLPAGKTLDSLHYFFTDAAGGNKVGYGGGTDTAFTFIFNCQ
ncbi:MAG TPA: DUF4961 domain-containing protein [Dinghuibacter sp.]|jgi:hypothetical protein|uniref:DUF4961 domain-containing protein n=1 Tax=Dinghuibacter sp. TaxID=2024697 RepID=UPI002CDE4CDC|nr:DUF4961 domain-containing protein [Dinghuibacter sp.]HTJ13478.1 DUF4961 domain-containing protein [Dinghuibacter sp.]